MLAVNGYYDGNVCRIEEKVFKKPQKVIITFLNDEPVKQKEKKGINRIQESYDSVVEEAFGIWKDHNTSVSVDACVRNMRKGRNFDI